jgi:hypothetical protein
LIRVIEYDVLPIRHPPPRVTCAIVGSRKMDHLESYLAADGIELSSDLPGRIDDVVPPGHTVNIADNMWATSTSSLDVASRRR